MKTLHVVLLGKESNGVTRHLQDHRTCETIPLKVKRSQGHQVPKPWRYATCKDNERTFRNSFLSETPLPGWTGKKELLELCAQHWGGAKKTPAFEERRTTHT